MLFGIGLALLTIGTCMADSESLIIPLVITGTGALLMWISAGRKGADEN